MRRRAAALAVPLTVIALAVSSCGSIPEDWRTPAFLQMGEEELDPRLPDITGEVGEEPEVTIPDEEPPDEEISGVVSEGASENELVRADDLLVANVVQYQWTGPGEGEPVEGQSSYENGAPDLVRLEQMPEEISGALVNQPTGSRAVYVFPPMTEEERQQAEMSGQPVQEGASILIVDMMESYPKGSVVPGEQTSNGGDGLPEVTQEGHSEPTIEVPDTDPPEDLETTPLVEGEGAEVEEGQQVIVQYTGVPWEADENGERPVFDSTWSRAGDPFDTTIGGGQVIQGWDEGLVGQRVGSRLLLVVPGDMAYGEDPEQTGGAPAGTLVFVIDILGAYDNPPPPEEGGEGGTPEEGAEAPAEGGE